MKRAREIAAIVLAGALALVLGAPAADAREPAPSDGTVAAAALHGALPEFLTDDESPEIQLRQLRIFYQQNSIQDVWRLHMAPVLAPGVEAADPADEPQYTTAELEAFRAKMDGFLVDLADLLDYLPEERVLDAPLRVMESRRVVEIATAEQLAEVKALYDQYPGYLETPGYVLSVLQGATPVESPRGVMPERSLDLPVLPNVVIPVPDEPIPQHPNCRLYGGTGIGDNGTCANCPAPPAGNLATVFALDTAAFVNGAICEYIPDAIFVLSVSIQNPFKLLCTLLRSGFEIAAASVAYQSKLNANCELAYHWGILHAYLDAEISTRASQKSFDFYSARHLRLGIEDNLLDVLDDRVSTYQLPRSQLGYLDAQDDVSVRYVVADTIYMQGEAGYTGETIRNAQDEYNAAEALLAGGDYKNAYARYRKAYRAAVRVGREP